MFKYLLHIERAVLYYYFPSYYQVRNALNLRGTSVVRYFKSRRTLFCSEPGDMLTQSERYAWRIAGNRASGKTVSDLVIERSGLTESRISAFSFLAIVASIKYGLSGDGFKEEKVSVLRGESYSVMLDGDGMVARIGQAEISLSRREFSFLNVLIETRGNFVSLGKVYGLLYMDEMFEGGHKSAWDRILSILRRIESKLGGDIREPFFIAVDHARRGFLLNSRRWEFQDGDVYVYYKYSPFGAVESFKVEVDRILEVRYLDGHERHVQLTSNELAVFSYMISEAVCGQSGWIHYSRIIEEIFPGVIDRRGLYAVRNAIDNLKCKIGVMYPRPGYILSDGRGYIKLVTYREALLPGIKFATSCGTHYFRENILAICDERGNVVIRLTRSQARAFSNILNGLSSINPVLKHSLRVELVRHGVVAEDVRGLNWERRCLRVVGYTIPQLIEEIPWTQNISIERDHEGDYSVSLYSGESLIRTFRIPSEQFEEIFYADAMSPEAFDLATGELRDMEEALTREILSSDVLDLDLVARREAVEYPMIPKAVETILLIRCLAGDGTARLRIFRSNMRLAWRPALRTYYKLEGKIPFLDLLQEGYTGILEALDHFDPMESGENTPMVKFSTYATLWIKQRVGRFSRDTRSNIRIPLYKQYIFKRIWGIKKKLRDALGRKASPEEIVFDFIKCSEECIERIKSGTASISVMDEYEKVLGYVRESYTYGGGELSLDQPIHRGDERALADQVGTRASVIDTQMRLQETSLSAEITMIISELDLSERELMMFYMRYGFLDGRFYTFGEIGERFNLTKERIRQIIKKIESRLRHPRYTRRLRDFI